MSTRIQPITAESRQSLWPLVLPPSLWLAHFLISYGVLAVWCGTLGPIASLGSLSVGFGIVTAFVLIAIAAAGKKGWTRYRHTGDDSSAVPSHHKDTPEDRHRFLGLATVLLAALSAVATLYVVMAVAVLGNCG